MRARDKRQPIHGIFIPLFSDSYEGDDGSTEGCGTQRLKGLQSSGIQQGQDSRIKKENGAHKRTQEMEPQGG